METLSDFLGLPFDTTGIILLAGLSFLLSLLVLIAIFLSRIRRTIQRLRRQEVKHITISQNVLRFLITLIWALASLSVLFIAGFAQSFTNFNKEEVVAEVRCITVNDELNAMLLQLTPVVEGKPGTTKEFLLSGDQWAVEGDIIKWDEWLNFAGMHTMYKLTRVRGRYLHVADEINQHRTVYSLVEKEDDPRWRWLYKYGYNLRFVDAVYGNTVYHFPDETKTYEVLVTTSGLIAKIKENRL